MNPRIRPAILQEKERDRVRCLACERRCLLRERERGYCRTRQNIEGVLYTLVYGEIAPDETGIALNPIEKKPLYHFRPGTRCVTVGTWSCNFPCPWCQNWWLSKRPEAIGTGYYLDPDGFIALAVDLGAEGTSFSFNEPTLLLEYALDVFPIAREKGLYNTYVTNGYMTLEALDLLVKGGLDAVNIDIKGDEEVYRRYCGAEVDVVWRNARQAKQRGVWVELTTLLIPGVNDKDELIRGIARRILEELGPDTPWHLTGYYPAYRFHAPPTPKGTVERAWEIGRSEGLRFVYIGNFPGHPMQNTYCPSCGLLLVERAGFEVRSLRIGDSRCPRCGLFIPIKL